MKILHFFDCLICKIVICARGSEKKPVSWICKNLFIIIWSKSVFWPATYYYGNLTRQICRIFYLLQKCFSQEDFKGQVFRFFLPLEELESFLNPVYIYGLRRQKKSGWKVTHFNQAKNFGVLFSREVQSIFWTDSSLLSSPISWQIIIWSDSNSELPSRLVSRSSSWWGAQN